MRKPVFTKKLALAAIRNTTLASTLVLLLHVLMEMEVDLVLCIMPLRR
jgi:hypothetical protein